MFGVELTGAEVWLVLSDPAVFEICFSTPSLTESTFISSLLASNSVLSLIEESVCNIILALEGSFTKDAAFTSEVVEVGAAESFELEEASSKCLEETGFANL